MLLPGHYHARMCTDQNNDIITRSYNVIEASLMSLSFVPPGEKWSGERSQISWAYFPKVVRTNEICEIGNSYVALPVKQIKKKSLLEYPCLF